MPSLLQPKKTATTRGAQTWRHTIMSAFRIVARQLGSEFSGYEKRFGPRNASH
jgi:hypothetical protein